MFDIRHWTGGAAAVAIAAALTPAAVAQQTTSTIRGSVTDEAGNPIAGASVTVTDTRTGATRRTTSGAGGEFTASGLTVGGPYTVTVTATEYQGRTVENVTVVLNADSRVNFALAPASAGDTIVVTATRSNVAEVAIGPSSSYNLETIEGFPSIQREIADIIRLDPRVSIDLSNDVQRISCIGSNDRSNTLTVDGVIRADVFGLNGTAFAARNTFIVPFDAVSQSSVEFAPFDVEYGQFTGCNINIVTKSGSNEFHGSAYGFYTNDSLQGTELEGESFEIQPFDDYNYGATISGPIIKDRLFFFYAFEETDDADALISGPQGAGFAQEFDLTVAEANELISIAENTYGINTQGIATSLPQSSTRHLARFDWIIADGHRAEFTYDKLTESNVEPDDFGFRFGTFTPFGSFEDEGTESETYSLRLFNQWSDRFSTEFRISRAEVGDIQGPVGGGEAQSGSPQVRVAVPFSAEDYFIAGPGNFRSANQLDTVVDQLKIKGSYEKGNHTFTGGYEYNNLDVFNLFIRNATGLLSFGSVDDFRNGVLLSGTDDAEFPGANRLNNNLQSGAWGNFSFSGDPNDAAAEFERTIHSLYVQDEWRPTQDLEILLGLRYEWWSGDDAPLENPLFEQRYGFPNTTDFSGLDIVMPRFGLTYDLPRGQFGDISLRLGSGVFTGGDPTVWFSNAFSNTGSNAGDGNLAFAPGCTAADSDVVDDSGNFTGFPTCVAEDGANRAALGLADTQSTDPNLELASVIRSNLGFTWNTDFNGAAKGLFDDWQVDVDYIYSRFVNPYNFVDLSQTLDTRTVSTGFTVDGRPIYQAIDANEPGCNAVLQGQGGTPPVYTGVTAECFDTRRDDEIQLTNAEGFDSHTVSFIASRYVPFTVPGSNDGGVRINLGYAFTDAQNRRDLTSSQSTSNYDGSALFDRQNPGVGTSGFETRHNITLATSWRQEFFKDYATRVGLFFSARSGQPYSYTFDNSGVFSDFSSGRDNALLYVPTGLNDPNISPDSDPAALQSLLDFIEGDECLREDVGGTATRNGCRGDWFLDLDMRIAQEIPVPGNWLEDKLTAYIDIDNLANLFSSEANLRRLTNSNVDLVDRGLDDQGRYVISGFRPDFGTSVQDAASLWRVQFGLRYEF